MPSFVRLALHQNSFTIAKPVAASGQTDYIDVTHWISGRPSSFAVGFAGAGGPERCEISRFRVKLR